MAIYHCSVKIISRSQGRSATGAAAYRSAEKIRDERTGLEHDYTRKSGVDHTEIVAPANSPDWVQNRSELWNHVEHSEKRKDARLCREVEVALPCELDLKQNLKLIRDFVKSEFVDKGMIADVAIHHAKGDNPHAHILLTTREITPEGFGPKNRDWNKTEALEQWRKSWQDHANTALEQACHTSRIDHRTLEAQGIERLPQIHLGAKVIKMENQGIKTERGARAMDIENANTKIADLQDYREILNREYHRELEKSQNTRAAGQPDRTHGASSGNTGPDSHRSDRAVQPREPSPVQSMDRLPDQNSEGVGNSRQEPSGGSTGSHPSHEQRIQSATPSAADDSPDLADEFNDRYSGAYDRILALAESNTLQRERISMDSAPNRRLDRTYLAVRRQLKALGAKIYDIGIKTAKGMLNREWSMEQVLKHIPWLKGENAKGADIYVRPAGEKNQGILLVDDVNLARIEHLKKSGFEPAAVVETSPANYQAWIRLTSNEIEPVLATGISKALATQAQGDPNSADWKHFGRLAGFTNQKPEHRTARGQNPWVLCHESSGRQASRGEEMIRFITDSHLQNQAQKEKEYRLNQAIEAPQRRSNDHLIQTYQNNFKALYERYGADMDLSRADYMICKSMAKGGASPAQLTRTLEEASPELSTRKANHEQDYCQRTVKAVFDDQEVIQHLQRLQEIQQQAKKSRSRGHSR